jgi:hypothetical protein
MCGESTCSSLSRCRHFFKRPITSFLVIFHLLLSDIKTAVRHTKRIAIISGCCWNLVVCFGWNWVKLNFSVGKGRYRNSILWGITIGSEVTSFYKLLNALWANGESNRKRVWEPIDGPGNPKYTEGMVEHGIHFRFPVSTRVGKCVDYIVMEGMA